MSLKRSGWPRPAYVRPPQRLNSIERASKPWAQGPVEPVEKTPGRVDSKIRDSARGEECTVRIVGACTFDPAMTIWSHAPMQAAGKGKAIKALDLCGAYCCTACDAVVDGQRFLPPGATRESVQLDWHAGHLRSLVRLRQKGLV